MYGTALIDNLKSVCVLVLGEFFVLVFALVALSPFVTRAEKKGSSFMALRSNRSDEVSWLWSLRR